MTADLARTAMCFLQRRSAMPARRAHRAHLACQATRDRRERRDRQASLVDLEALAHRANADQQEIAAHLARTEALDRKDHRVTLAKTFQRTGHLAALDPLDHPVLRAPADPSDRPAKSAKMDHRESRVTKVILALTANQHHLVAKAHEDREDRPATAITVRLLALHRATIQVQDQWPAVQLQVDIPVAESRTKPDDVLVSALLETI